jgi:hypothetical protein
LHCKKNSSINYDELASLAEECDPQLRECLFKALKWMRDVDSYNFLHGLKDAPCKAKLSQKQVLQLEKAGMCKRLELGKTPRGEVKVFLVPEWHKDRARVIEHPRYVNDVTESRCQTIKLISLGKLLESVWLGDYGMNADFEGYYHLFDLADEVSLCFCFSDCEGKPWRWTVGLTGLRPMVEVAQFSTLVITNINDETLNPAFQVSYFDNLGFKDNDVNKLKRIATLVETRAEKVGVVFSEKFHISQQLDELGVIMDLANKLVSVRPRTIGKIAVSWQHRSKWTCRNFAGHISSLCYASTILRYDPSNFTTCLKCYARMASKLARNECQWDDPYAFWDCIFEELEKWTLYCLANKPVHPRKPREPYNHVIVTDACPYGFGALHWCAERNKISYTQHHWGLHCEAYSTHFESQTFAIAIHTFLRPEDHDNCIGVSDNTSTVALFTKHYSLQSPVMNSHAFWVFNTYKNLNLTMKYIEGKKNTIPDALSRGQQLNSSQDETRRFMAMAVGEGDLYKMPDLFVHHGKNNDDDVLLDNSLHFVEPKFFPSFS